MSSYSCRTQFFESFESQSSDTSSVAGQKDSGSGEWSTIAKNWEIRHVDCQSSNVTYDDGNRFHPLVDIQDLCYQVNPTLLRRLLDPTKKYGILQTRHLLDFKSGELLHEDCPFLICPCVPFFLILNLDSRRRGKWRSHSLRVTTKRRSCIRPYLSSNTLTTFSFASSW